MWRVLETELRRRLNGHEDGNVGYSQGVSYGLPRQRPTLPDGRRAHGSTARSLRTIAPRSGGAIRTRAFRVEGDAVEVEDDGLAGTPDHDNQRVAPVKPLAPLVFAIT